MTDANARDLIKRLADALHDAADDVEGWGNYATNYFQKKHDLSGNVARIRAQADEARAFLAQHESIGDRIAKADAAIEASMERVRAIASSYPARVYLAQPEPEGPTDEELLAIAAASINPYQDSGIAIGEYESETERAVHVYGSELITFAHAVLARWGRPPQ
jgi:soluble lytic murein transglycosylase-like protein